MIHKTNILTVKPEIYVYTGHSVHLILVIVHGEITLLDNCSLLCSISANRLLNERNSGLIYQTYV